MLGFLSAIITVATIITVALAKIIMNCSYRTGRSRTLALKTAKGYLRKQTIRLNLLIEINIELF